MCKQTDLWQFISIVLFLVKSTDGRKLSHCGLRGGVLTHGSHFSHKILLYLFLFITFLRQGNNQGKRESD